MWKCKAVLFPSLEKAIYSFHPNDLTLINVRNLHSSYFDTDSPFQSSSVKLLPVLGFTCNERIFYEVRVEETHDRMCTFCNGFLHQLEECIQRTASFEIWEFSGGFQGVFSPLSYSCAELITTGSSKVISYFWLFEQVKKKKKRKTFLHCRQSNFFLLHLSAKIISVSESHLHSSDPSGCSNAGVVHTGHTSGTAGCRLSDLLFPLPEEKLAGWFCKPLCLQFSAWRKHQVWFLPCTLHTPFPLGLQECGKQSTPLLSCFTKGLPVLDLQLQRRLSHTRWPPPAGAPPCWLPGQAEVHLLLLPSRVLKMREPGRMGGLLLVKTKSLQTCLTVCPQWVLIFRKDAFIFLSFPFFAYLITSCCGQQRWAIQPSFSTKFGPSLGSTSLRTSPAEHGETAISSSSQK